MALCLPHGIYRAHAGLTKFYISFFSFGTINNDLFLGYFRPKGLLKFYFW